MAFKSALTVASIALMPLLPLSLWQLRQKQEMVVDGGLNSQTATDNAFSKTNFVQSLLIPGFIQALMVVDGDLDSPTATDNVFLKINFVQSLLIPSFIRSLMVVDGDLNSQTATDNAFSKINFVQWLSIPYIHPCL